MTLTWGVLTLSQSLDDEGKSQEAEEQDIEFFEAGEDAAGCPTRGRLTGGPRCRWDQEILRM